MKWSHNEYQEATFLAREAGLQLLARLPLLTIQPKTIVVLGYGFQEISRELQQLYPQAKVIFVADNVAELTEARVQRCIAEAINLPIKTNSVDLLVANFCLPWVEEAAKLLPEWRRILRAEGVLLFNALGLDTLKEYQSQWQNAIIPGLSDIHQLGDSLTQTGFLDPVLDNNFYQLNYREAKKMLRELYIAGILALANDEDVLKRLAEMEVLQLTFEIIQVHTFAPAKQQAQAKHGIAKIPIADLKQSLRRKG